jgi:hypothetical protein
VFAWSCLLLIHGILAGLRQKFQLSVRPNTGGHLSYLFHAGSMACTTMYESGPAGNKNLTKAP